jgi:hypothetical protein
VVVVQALGMTIALASWERRAAGAQVEPLGG